MAKRRFTEESWHSHPWFKALCSALFSCKHEEEIADVLRDIGTLSELQAWSERLEVAKQLAAGLTYRQVAANTGASTTTVTRVARYLENGTGYKKLLKFHQTPRIKRQIQEMQDLKDTKTEKMVQEAQ